MERIFIMENSSEQKNTALFDKNYTDDARSILTPLYFLPLQLSNVESKNFAPMLLVNDKTTGKTNKFPFDAHEGKILKWKQNAQNILTFSQTINFMQNQDDDQLRKLRFGVLLQDNFFSDGSNLIVIDIDHRADLVKQARNQKITSDDVQAQVVKYALESGFYIEVSQSGAGLHILMKGHKENKKLIRNDKFEYYDSNRWLCLTGNSINPKFNNNLEVDDKKIGILETVMFTREERQRSKKVEKKQQIPDTQRGNSKSDEELLNKIRNSKNAKKFNALWNNDTKSKYVTDDHSYNDLQLVLMLTWWCNHDMNRVDKLFRQSALMRDKWDEQHRADGATYGEMQLENADAQISGGYTGLSIKELLSQNAEIFESNSACSNYLKDLRQQRDQSVKANGDDPKNVKSDEVVTVLKNTLILKKIYNVDSADARRTAPLFYWDFDSKIYIQDYRLLNGFILDYAPEIVSSRIRGDIIKALESSNDVKTEANFDLSDPDQQFLAVANGILDLTTKELKPLSPKNNFTYKLATPYDALATVEPEFTYFDKVTKKKTVWSFTKSLKENCKGPEGNDKFYQIMQVLKCAVIGYSSARKLALFCDSSGIDGSHTGKSTLEEVAKYVAGDENVAKLQLKDMNDRKNLSMLLEKRYIYGDDNDVNSIIKDVGVLNPMISGDPITIKKLYQEPFTTNFHGFVIQSCNGLPNFENLTYATLSRILPIRFTAQHDEKNPANRKVKSTYIKDLKFRKWLLNYLVTNVDITHGFVELTETKEILHQISVESDSITNFVDNWLPQLTSAKLPLGFIYSFYVTASLHDHLKPISSRLFARKLSENEDFKKNWDKKRTRIQLSHFEKKDNKAVKDENGMPKYIHEFDSEDANYLARLASSTKGKTQSFFTVVRSSISTAQDEDTRYTKSEAPHIEEQTLLDFFDRFHGMSIIAKNN